MVRKPNDDGVMYFRSNTENWDDTLVPWGMSGGGGGYAAAPPDAAQPGTARARARARAEEELDAADKAEALTDAAKEQARLLGMQIVRRLVSKSGLTLRQIQERTGIRAGTISRIATGGTDTGPHLWTLLALARATGVPIEIREAEG